MNKPTRFQFKAHGKQFVLASEHEDYVAFIKAELEVQNQRIDRRDEDVGRLYCENYRLKAENERLRRAGDAMAEAFNLKYPVAGGLINAWIAAKEGKQP